MFGISFFFFYLFSYLFLDANLSIRSFNKLSVVVLDLSVVIPMWMSYMVISLSLWIAFVSFGTSLIWFCCHDAPSKGNYSIFEMWCSTMNRLNWWCQLAVWVLVSAPAVAVARLIKLPAKGWGKALEKSPCVFGAVSPTRESWIKFPDPGFNPI